MGLREVLRGVKAKKVCLVACSSASRRSCNLQLPTKSYCSKFGPENDRRRYFVYVLIKRKNNTLIVYTRPLCSFHGVKPPLW